MIVLSNTWHYPELNWQYSAAYAEEGKRKEVVSYFDKSLKNRQSVTLMKNSTSVAGVDGLEAVVQSTIYDQYGRPAVEVLPAPLAGMTTLNFYPRLNRKLDNTAYSWMDVAPEDRSCDYLIPPMSDAAGASRYYSMQNDFKAIDNHSAVPDAGKYPFSLRYYTNDNTGRIASQGGVGAMFQPKKDPTNDSSRATRYFYSKPTRKEIYRLFGNDAGDASHYTKNTVIDPNGQVSVSYVNLSGKTVATALSGSEPANLDPLPGRPVPKPVTVALFKNADFTYDPGKLTLSAAQTYIANETGPIKFSVEMERLYSQINTGNKQFCTACGFEIVLTVSSDCSDFTPDTVVMAGAPPDSACSGSNAALKKDVTFDFTRKGNYYVQMQARLKPDEIRQRVDQYVTVASNKLRKKFDFVIEELRAVDFGGCFDDCKTCKWTLGTKADFRSKVKEKLLALNAINITDTTVVSAWTDSLYNRLSAACELAQATCAVDPCKQLKELLQRDVSPYGQYALFNKDTLALEQSVNVLHLYWRTVFPPLPRTDTTYIKNIVQLQDGGKLSVNDSSFTLKNLVYSWRQEWAERFQGYHPEACGLMYCEDNIAYLKWDDRVKSMINSTTDIPVVLGAGAQWDKDNPLWLSARDPFFAPQAPGYSSLTAFREDLNKYSSRVIGLVTDTVKNINKYVDFMLYCVSKNGEITNVNEEDNNWNYCSPSPSCRIPDREWKMYVAAYMELKQKYYQTARNGNASYCRDACTVGTPVGVGEGCPPAGAFTFTPVSVTGNNQTVRVRYEGGRAARSMTVQFYYPQEYGTLQQVAASTFLVNDTEKMIIIHKDIDVSTLGVKDVICSGGTTVIPCSGVSFTLDLGTSGRRKGYRMWDNVENGQSVSYIAVEGSKDVPPVAANYCQNPASINFYNCLFIKSSQADAPEEYLENVWLIQCPPNNCLYPGSFYATQKVGEYNFKNNAFDIAIYPYTPQINNISGPTCITKTKEWHDCFTVELQGVQYTFRNATVFKCSMNCSTIQVSEGSGTEFRYNTTGTSSLYTVYSFPPYEGLVCSDPNATLFEVKDFSNTCVEFVFESTGERVPFSGVWVVECHAFNNGLTAVQSFSTTTGCPDALKTKQSRLNNVDYAVPSLETMNEIRKEGVAQMQLQMNTVCDDQADLWISRLEQCGTGLPDWAVKKVTLRTKLIELCKKGVDIRHPNGASTHPDQVAGTPKDFKEVIKTVLAITNLSADCNPWLIDMPYPHAKPMPLAPPVILNSNPEICSRVRELQQAHNGLPTPRPSFYQYLVNEFGPAMTLNEAELTALVNSCGACAYLLPREVSLPVFLNGQGKGFITGDELQQGFTALAAENLTNLAATHPNYETIITNFLNHRFGFTLGYWDYARMKRSLDSNVIPVTSKLVNIPAFGVTQVDPYECLFSMVQHAAYNGMSSYDLYMEEVKRAFRAEYIRDCSGAGGKLSITHTENEYHYTLYYYDQAGNLVRTVPPEGVIPLSDVEAAQAEEAAGMNIESCTFNGPPAATDLSLSKTYLGNALSAGTKTLEMWLYSPLLPHGQLAISTGTDGYFLSACIGTDNMELDIYKLKSGNAGSNSVEIERSRHFKVKLTSEVLRPWLHLVLQGSNMGLDGGSLAVYVNGVLCPAVTTGTMPGSCGWEIGYVNNVLTLPNDISLLKQIRGYNKLLSAQEISYQFSLACMGVDSSLRVASQEHWGRFNVPGTGTATTVGNTTTETKHSRIFPVHHLNTTYAYQSLNGVFRQESPDAGVSDMWYDLLGRVVASRNAQQLKDGRMSYTEFDNQGRVLEAGEKAAPTEWPTTFMSDSLARAFIDNNKATRKHYVINVYDESLTGMLGQGAYQEDVQANLVQENLRKRVSASLLYEHPAASPVATIYSYDILGNVKSMLMKLPDFHFKRIDYNYDLASGKVLFVRYKHNAANKFIYQYRYDAENRLTEAITGIQTTSADDWGIASSRQNAYYKYYKHGPLARTQLGGNIQGLDFVYTLQGWLKAINGQKQGVDIGKDGHAGINATFATDVFNYSLDYFNGDYAPVSSPPTGPAPDFPLAWPYNETPGTGRSLFNGNIARVTMGRTNGSTVTETVGYTYRYDQLNRLTQMRHHAGIGNGNFAADIKYGENIAYDANGNIKTFQRNGHDAGGILMDDLTYAYPVIGGKLTQNRLRHITDAAPANANYTTDLKTQPVDNYEYDDIGNLTKDSSEGIRHITWTVTGKIEEIQKNNGYIRYKYDPSGNRVYKEVSLGGPAVRTWYVRDAQGNLLALYSDNGTAVVTWEEQHLYGSSRLGYWRLGVNSSQTLTTAWNEAPGNTLYELTNHLGNTMVVVTGAKTSEGKATVMSMQDYYSFGSIMPGRNWENSYLGKRYRYGFNGKENDNEVKGIEGSQQDYGMRIYDPRVGKFLSVDPLTSDYAYYTPYQFAGNTPVWATDLDGAEENTTGTYTYRPPVLSRVNMVMIHGNAHVASAVHRQPSVRADTRSSLERQIQKQKAEETQLYRQLYETQGGASFRILHGAGEAVTAAVGDLALNAAWKIAAKYGKQAYNVARTEMSAARMALSGASKEARLAMYGSKALEGSSPALRLAEPFDDVSFANEIIAINKTTEGGGVILNTTPMSAINSAMYYETAAEQGAAIFRSISHGHMFIDGNKRTAVAAFESFAKKHGLSTVGKDEMSNVATEVAKGKLTDVSEIAKKLIKNE
ncbi:RHS repeat-associated core domain-containing protein [Chitinophaga pollutisoli]|uniref:RHS repeat-associated core domain-containing protein n=1 Tax=Chitinophaga pollutisoli TaxID=3133966 RepID=A0ABZ2YP91_9BACT